MTTTCQYCGSPASANFCSICGNTLQPSARTTHTHYSHHAPHFHAGSGAGTAAISGAAIPSAGGTLSSKPQETLESVFGPLLKKFFGWSELINAALTVHTPLSGIRKLLNSSHVALSQAFIAYIEFVTIIPFIITQIIHPMGRSVGYPVIYQGAVVENTVVFYFVTAISGGLGLLLLYLLPNSLFSPRTKPLVIAANLYMAMYAAVYTTAADFLKVGLWVATGDLTWSTILGYAVAIGVMILQFYVWRKVLKLSWTTAIVFMVLGTIILIAQNYLLMELGLLKFNEG